LQLNPRVGETTLCAECGAESCVGGTGVSGVGVSHHDDGVTSRPGADVVGDLLQVGVAGYVVLILVAGLLSAGNLFWNIVQTHPASACKLYTSM
jgi:hypothetical protein